MTILRPGENEAQSGRIPAFKAHLEIQMFRLESSKSVEGGLASIKQLKQKIIACISYGVCPLSPSRTFMWNRLMLLIDVYFRFGKVCVRY